MSQINLKLLFLITFAEYLAIKCGNSLFNLHSTRKNKQFTPFILYFSHFGNKGRKNSNNNIQNIIFRTLKMQRRTGLKSDWVTQK